MLRKAKTKKTGTKKKTKAPAKPKPKHDWNIQNNIDEVKANDPTGKESLSLSHDENDNTVMFTFSNSDDNEAYLEMPDEAFKEFLIQINGFAVAKGV